MTMILEAIWIFDGLKWWYLLGFLQKSHSRFWTLSYQLSLVTDCLSDYSFLRLLVIKQWGMWHHKCLFLAVTGKLQNPCHVLFREKLMPWVHILFLVCIRMLCLMRWPLYESHQHACFYPNWSIMFRDKSSGLATLLLLF